MKLDIYALVTGGEWEDVVYYKDYFSAISALQRNISPTCFLAHYTCEEDEDRFHFTTKYVYDITTKNITITTVREY